MWGMSYELCEAWVMSYVRHELWVMWGMSYELCEAWVKVTGYRFNHESWVTSQDWLQKGKKAKVQKMTRCEFRFKIITANHHSNQAACAIHQATVPVEQTTDQIVVRCLAVWVVVTGGGWEISNLHSVSFGRCQPGLPERCWRPWLQACTYHQLWPSTTLCWPADHT